MSTGVAPTSDRPRARQGADRAREQAARRSHAGLEGDVRARAGGHARRRALLVPGARAVADLPRARRGRGRLGRRRPPALGLPQRLRLDAPGPRAPGDRQGGRGARPAGHPVRSSDGGRDRGRRGARPPLRPAEVALQQLRLRGDDGRDPDRPRPDRARHDPQDLRLVPRPPRRGDGRGRRRRHRRRSGRHPVHHVRRRRAAGGRRPHGRGSLQRRRSAGADASSASTPRAESPPA